jgi:hypothetical protein
VRPASHGIDGSLTGHLPFLPRRSSLEIVGLIAVAL